MVENFIDGFRRWDKRIIEQEGLSDQIYKDWQDKTLIQLTNLDTYETDRYLTPEITHAVFYTQNSSPKKMKELYIKKTLDSLMRLNNENSNFKHYIWTNNKDSIPQELKELSNLEIKLITEFQEHSLYPNLVNLLEKGQKDSSAFVEASDITRIIILQKFGGIYHDLDYEIFDAKAILKFMKSFNYFNAKESDSLDSTIGNAFIACSPNHPIIDEMVRMIKSHLNKEPDCPQYIYFPYNNFDKVIMQTGPVAITIATHKAMNLNGNIDIVFPAGVLYNAKKAGNSDADPTKTSFFNIPIQSAGGDLFAGTWGTKNYLEEIKYTDKDYYKYFKTLLTKELDLFQFIEIKDFATKYSYQELIDDSFIKLTLNSKNIIKNDILNYLFELSIEKNQKNIFDQILPKIIDQKTLDKALKLSYDFERYEMFNQLFSDKNDPSLLKDLFDRAVNHNERDIIFPKILSKISDSEFLAKALHKSIEDNRIERFEQIFPKLLEEQILVEALRKSSKYKRTEMFYKILPSITDEKHLVDYFYKSVESNDEFLFQQILPKILDQKTLDKALKLSYDFERYEMFNQLFSDKNDPSLLKDLFDRAVHYNERDIIFPKILSKISDSEFLAKALHKSIEDNRIERFEQIFPKLLEEQILVEALRKSSKYKRTEMFYKILPSITDEKHLVDYFYKSVESNNEFLFQQILPKILDRKTLDKALKLAYDFERYEMFNQLFSDKNDPSLLKDLFDRAVHYNERDIIFPKILSKISDSESLAKALHKSIEDNNIERLKQIFPEIKDTEFLFSEFHFACKNGGEEIQKIACLGINTTDTD